jgi:hypothetical protein
MRPLAHLGGLVMGLVTAYFAIAAYGRHVEETRAEAERALTVAVDDLWLQALDLGVDPNRWPEVRFEPLDAGRMAETHCGRRPAIVFNTAKLEQRWYLTELAVPHELAHVLVCLDGGVTWGAEPHGPAWERRVRDLLPHERAEEVLAEERALESAP